jgi:SAM-dependent methyltransferase
MEQPLAQRMPRGLRDTRRWYRDVDPMSQVAGDLVDFVAANAGPKVLDVGCGLGGYSRALTQRGFECYGLDVVDEYVEVARRLGVRADRYDGDRLPLDDRSVDTVILLEVLEHLEDPGHLLREAARVTTRNVLITTPNCTQSFDSVPIEFTHMLDVDHRQFFTVDSLRQLLETTFPAVEVRQGFPLDEKIAGLVLPRPLMAVYLRLAARRLIRPGYYFRLLAQAWVADGTAH